MPICTPYRPPRRGRLRPPRMGGVLAAVAVVALAAVLTLPAAFEPAAATGEYRPLAQRIQFKRDGHFNLRERGLAAAPPMSTAFRAVV